MNNKIKKVLSLILSLVMVLSLFGCSKEDNTKGERNSTTDNSGTLDITMNSNGEPETSKTTQSTISLREITSTGDIPYDKYGVFLNGFYMGDFLRNSDYSNYFSTELFPFTYNKKVGYADAFGNVAIAEKYDYGILFSENKAFVYEIIDNKMVWKVIDTKGNELLTLPEGSNSSYTLGYSCKNTYFKEEYALIMSNSKDKVLVIDAEMNYKEIAIKEDLAVHEFKSINTADFVGYLLYCWENDEKEISLYDVAGNEVWSKRIKTYEKYDLDKFVVKNGFMNIIDDNGKWGLFDIESKETVIECNYDYLGEYSDGVCVINSYDKWGCIDINNNIIIKPSFTFITPFVNDRAFAVTNDGGSVVINKTGKILTQCNFSVEQNCISNIVPFSSETGITAVYQDIHPEVNYENQVYVITDKGEILFFKGDCKSLYISGKYIFIDNKMYEIIK